MCVGVQEEILADAHSLLSGFCALAPPCRIQLEISGTFLCSLWRNNFKPTSFSNDKVECRPKCRLLDIENENCISICYNQNFKSLYLHRSTAIERLQW